MSAGDYQHVTLPYGVLPSDVVHVSTVFGPFVSAMISGRYLRATQQYPSSVHPQTVPRSVLQLGTLWRPLSTTLHLLAPFPQRPHVHQDSRLCRLRTRYILHGNNYACRLASTRAVLGRYQYPSPTSMDMGDGSSQQWSRQVFPVPDKTNIPLIPSSL